VDILVSERDSIDDVLVGERILSFQERGPEIRSS